MMQFADFPQSDFDPFASSSDNNNTVGGGGRARGSVSGFSDPWVRQSPQSNSPASVAAGISRALLSAISPSSRARRKRKLSFNENRVRTCSGLKEADIDDSDDDDSLSAGSLGVERLTDSEDEEDEKQGGFSEECGSVAKRIPTARDDAQRRSKHNALATLMAGAKGYFSGVFARVPFTFAPNKTNTTVRFSEGMCCSVCRHCRNDHWIGCHFDACCW
eukprot:INCI14140.2.p1 GENE.INCI14140.2~~INCI14140.2.p1  ORF type:complete len:218 (+),score=38.39 INCI14140.2:395-1048(+)